MTEFIEFLTLWHKHQLVQERRCMAVAQSMCLPQSQSWWHANVPLDPMGVILVLFPRSSNLISHFPVCCWAVYSVRTSLGSPVGSRVLLKTLIWNDLCDFFRHNRVMTKMLAVGLFCFIRGSSQMVSGTWTYSELPGQLVPKWYQPTIFKWKTKPPI